MTLLKNSLFAIVLIYSSFAFAQPPQDSQGWTVFTPSNDSRIIYVSDSFGNDINNGLSMAAPKKTIAAGYALLRDGYPDHLLLKRGDTFSISSLIFWDKNGRSGTELMLMGAYGPVSVPRPIINTNTLDGIAHHQGGSYYFNNIAITGIHWVGPGASTVKSGINILGPGNNLYIEDCLFEQFGTGIVLQGADVANGGPLKNVQIRRNIIMDCFSAGSSHSQGFYISKTDTLLVEENVFDHNGWHDTIAAADPTIFNHNMYLQPSATNVIIKNNISARASSHGLQLRGGGTCTNNLFLQNALHMFISGRGGEVSNNVALYGKNIGAQPRGMGYSLNNKMPYALMEHNIVAHKGNNVGEGEGYDIRGWGGPGANQNSPRWANSYSSVLRENICYDWKGNSLQVVTENPSYPQGFDSLAVIVEGNEFQDNNNSQNVTVYAPLIGVSGQQYGSIVFNRNNYFSNRSGLGSYQNNWFGTNNPNNYYSNAQWPVISGETNAGYTSFSYIDPTRDISSYMASIGGTPTLDAFLTEARQQRKGYWRTEYTANEVNCYIREGFQTPVTYAHSADTVTICAGHSTILSISGLNTNNYSLQWNGGLPTTNLNYTVTPTITTTYSLEIIDSTQLWKMCAPLTHQFTVIVKNCAGIENITEQKLNVHPNPSQGNIVVSGISDITSMDIYSMLGHRIYSSSVEDTKQLNFGQSIDIGNYIEATGIYFITLYTRDKSYTQKVSLIK